MDPGDGLAAVDRTAAAFRPAGATAGEPASQQTHPGLPGGDPGSLRRHHLGHHHAAQMESEFHGRKSAKDTLARSLGRTGREFYAQRQDRQRTRSGPIDAAKVHRSRARCAGRTEVESSRRAAQAEKFATAGHEGDRLEYLVRRGADSLGIFDAASAMSPWTGWRARSAMRAPLRKPSRSATCIADVLLTYILLAASFWLISLAVLVYLAHRISRPIQSLTAGLDASVAAGDLNARVPASTRRRSRPRHPGLQRHGRNSCRPPPSAWSPAPTRGRAALWRARWRTR